MKKLLGEYKNGNYNVQIFEDGTKIKMTEEDIFISDFPESMDIKITNKCDMHCFMCHEDSREDGEHASLTDEETIKFIQSLHPYMELAIGGGNPLEHPNLLWFLGQLKKRNIIANITVNQHHFMKNIEELRILTNHNLIRGLGVSLTEPTDEFIAAVKEFPNAVIHVINGVVTPSSMEELYGKDLKILILGYKEFRRGLQYFADRHEDIVVKKIWMNEHIKEITKNFKVVSFDNLALQQIDVKSLMTNEEWEEFYLGDDGSHTMYVDLVKREFASSSTSTDRYPVSNNIDDMFNVIRS